MELKLDSLKVSSMDPKIEIIGIIYKIFFGRFNNEIREKLIREPRFKQHENNLFISFGPTIILRIIIKSIESYLKNINEMNNLENIRLIIARIYDTF
jgi:CRISPR/Cas system-associated endonuclease Cas1